LPSADIVPSVDAVLPRGRSSLREQAALFVRLARSPSAAREVLANGSFAAGLVAVAVTCALAAASTVRFGGSVSVSDLVYGPQRTPLVNTMLEVLGTARTAVVVYLAEQVWSVALVATSLAPLFFWFLGATAVHAAARMFGAVRPFRRYATYAAYATAVALIPANLASLALEADPRSTLAALGRFLGFALVLWLGLLHYRGIAAYYALSSSRALAALVVAVTLFYLAPLVLVLVAIVGIVVAAVVLELA